MLFSLSLSQWHHMRRLAEALEMDEGGAGAAEAGHALDSYYADGDYGDEKMRQVQPALTYSASIISVCIKQTATEVTSCNR